MDVSRNRTYRGNTQKIDFAYICKFGRPIGPINRGILRFFRFSIFLETIGKKKFLVLNAANLAVNYCPNFNVSHLP